MKNIKIILWCAVLMAACYGGGLGWSSYDDGTYDQDGQKYKKEYQEKLKQKKIKEQENAGSSTN